MGKAIDREPFQFKWITPGGFPSVTFAWYGMNFNRACAEELGYPEKISIGYDQKRKIVAFRPTPKGEKGFQFSTKGNNIRVSHRDFIRYLQHQTGINFRGKGQRFIAEPIDGMLIVRLNERMNGNERAKEVNHS